VAERLQAGDFLSLFAPATRMVGADGPDNDGMADDRGRADSNRHFSAEAASFNDS
jgi:hypothetical protein